MTHLMDAKAKVVALTDEQVVIAQGLFIYEVDYSPEENWRGVRLDNVRKLIDDHEAAMADLRGKLNDALGATHGYMQALAAVEQKHQTLLSGLEALAGEWKREVGLNDPITPVVGAVTECADELLALVASAGLEGKGNGG